MVTEVTLKLAPIPQDTSVAIVSFPTIKAAATAASSIIRSGIQLAALEMMDDLQMQIVNRHGSASVKKRSKSTTTKRFVTLNLIQIRMA